MLCPITNNRAMKALRSKEDGWAHISCALLVPGMYFFDEIARDPIEGFKHIESWRFNSMCVECKGSKNGLVIDCWSQRKCCAKFHPGCAIKAGLGFEENEEGIVRYYCRKHKEVDGEDTECDVCSSRSRAGDMLLCEDCNKGCHLQCHSPPLDRIPDEMWFCPSCIRRKLILGTIIKLPAGKEASMSDTIRSIYVPVTKEYLHALPMPRAVITDDEFDDSESDEDEGADNYPIPRPSKKHKGNVNELVLPTVSEATRILSSLAPKDVSMRLKLECKYSEDAARWRAMLHSGFNLVTILKLYSHGLQ